MIKFTEIDPPAVTVSAGCRGCHNRPLYKGRNPLGELVGKIANPGSSPGFQLVAN